MPGAPAHVSRVSSNVQLVLMSAAVWSAFLPVLISSAVPGAAALLPGHTHWTASGVIPEHSHEVGDPHAQACLVETPSADVTAADGAQIACGADDTIGPGSLLIAPGAVGMSARAVTTASVLRVPAVLEAFTSAPPAPPPRS